MRFFARTDIGKVRRENQDSWKAYYDPKRDATVFVVCDGMGGAVAGSTASAMATDSFISHLQRCLANPYLESPDEMLRDAVSYANLRLYNHAFLHPEFRGMGTTLVGGIVLGNTVSVVNVGDSRGYLLDGVGRLSQITTDHSFVAELLARGKITKEQAKHHPKRNIITRALGMEANVRSDVFQPDPDEGARFLFCTDGLSNHLDDVEIGEMLLTGADPASCCQSMMKTVLERGATDNVTAAVLFMD